MTRVVVTLTAETVDEAVERARALPPDRADLVECRLDFLRRVDGNALTALVEALPDRALATFRPRREGGEFDGPEDARESVLLGALDAGFSAVDVEHDAPFADRVLDRARAAGATGILSRHDFKGTPPAADLEKFAAHARERGAAVAKVATYVRDGADAQALVDAALACRARGLRVAFMGVNDAFLRLLAPTLGLALAYAAPGERAVAAAGQRPAGDVKRVHAALAAARADAFSRLVFLFGDPVAHSRSPAFQNAAFQAAGIGASYVASRVPGARLADAVASLRALGALGANVTVPHKVAVLDHVDAVDPSARAAGAANTLVHDAGHVIAFNTDGPGALDALTAAGVDAAGERALVLGAGGAARAIAHALADAGARVTLANRTTGKAVDLAERFQLDVVDWRERADAARESALVVNATTLGLQDEESPLPEDALHRDLAVLDAVYARGGTPFVRAARRAGCRAVVPGEAMLLHQGARAFTLWTGKPAPLDVMRTALREAMRA